MSQIIQKKKLQESLRSKNRFCHTKPEKRGLSDLQNKNRLLGNFFSTTRLPSGSKYVILCFLRKYEIHKGWHLFRTHIIADINQCTRRKKRCNIFNKKLINQSPVRMPRLNNEQGEGEKKGCFPQQKI